MTRLAMLALGAVLAACSDSTGPRAPVYSLAGHWYVTGAATFDFVAGDVTLSAGALADSSDRGMRIDAAAQGQGCSLLRYRFTSSVGKADTIALRVSCEPGEYVEGYFSTLPDTVRSFSAGQLSLIVK